MVIDSLRAYFEAVARRGAEPRLGKVTGTWQIEIDGRGTWSIAVDKGKLSVTAGPAASPDARLKFDERGFLRIARGDDHENLLTAIIRGALLDFSGSVAFAQKLQALLPYPDAFDPGPGRHGATAPTQASRPS